MGDVRVVRNDGLVSIDGVEIGTRWVRPWDGKRPSPALVLLHEGLGSIPQWRRFPDLLVAATGSPALLYDRQGHGRSDSPQESRRLDYLHRAAFDELPAVLERCGVRRPLLVGHSDGATIALLYASRFETRGVVSIAGHVRVEQAALDGIRRTMERLDTDGIREALERHHGPKTGALLQAWAVTWLAPWFRGWDIRPKLRSVTCPVLAIQGSDDEYATPGHVDEIAAAVGGPVETWLVPGHGHAPHLASGGWVADRVARWLDRLL